MEITKKDITAELIRFKGIYFVYYIYRNKECVYIGSTKNLYSRMKCHMYSKDFDKIRLVEYKSKTEARVAENAEIFKYKPIENTFCTTRESYPIDAVEVISIQDKIDMINRICNR